MPIDWAAVHDGRQPAKTALPSYAFDRQRYWLPRRAATAGTGTSLLGAEDGTGTFRARWSTTSPAYLGDHRGADQAFAPAAAYPEMMLQLSDALFGETSRAVEHVHLLRMLPLGDDPATLRVGVRETAGGRTEVEITGGPPGEARVRYATAVLGAPGDRVTGPTGTGRRLRARLETLGEPDLTRPAAEVYAAYARSGLHYGPEFQRVESIARYDSDLAVVTIRGTGLRRDEYLPPPLLDAATQALAVFADDGENYVATRIARLLWFRKPRGARLRAVTRFLAPAGRYEETPGDAFSLDVLLLDGSRVVAEMRGMAFTRLSRPVAAATAPTPATPDVPPIDPAELRGLPEPRRLDHVVALIRRQVADALSITDVDVVHPHATFLELGVDSLVATAIAQTLHRALAVPLSASVLFDHPSVAALAEHLNDRLTGPDSLAALPR